MNNKKLMLARIAGWAILAAIAYDKFFHGMNISETIKGVGGMAIGVAFLVALWFGYSKLIEYVHDKDPSGVTGNIITMLIAAVIVLMLIK